MLGLDLSELKVILKRIAAALEGIDTSLDKIVECINRTENTK